MAKKLPKKGMITNAFIPDSDIVSQALDIQAYNDYNKEYDTPEKKAVHENFLENQRFERMGIKSPYKVLDDGVAIFDETATPVTDEEMQTLRPEQQAFATVKNELIAGYGRARRPNLAHSTLANSMTGKWADWFGADLDLYKGVETKKDGLYFKGNKLNLSPDELGYLSDFTRKTSGNDVEKSFLEKAGETTLSLLWDLPLMAAGNYAVQAGMKTTAVGSALLRSTGAFPRMIGQVLEQGVNFNLLGLPSTVKATQDEGVGGALDAVWHNVKLGAIGAATGTLGYAGGRAGLLSKILPGRPALQEELGAIAGSALFGYTSEKIAGASNDEALGSALSFAAMHFANPQAFEKVVHEGFLKGRAESNKVFVEVNNKGIHDAGFQPDYFIKEENKFYKINKNSFKDKGEVEKIGSADPIEVNDETASQFKEYWKTNDHYSERFYDALASERVTRNAERLYQSWKKEGITPEGMKEGSPNDADLRQLADHVAGAMMVGKVIKIFDNWKFIDSPELHNKAVAITNKFSVPYSFVKENVVRNVKKYLEDENSYLHDERMKGNEDVKALDPMDQELYKVRDLFVSELARNQKATLEPDEAVFVSPAGEHILVKVNDDGSVTQKDTGFTFNPPENRLAKDIASAQDIMLKDKEKPGEGTTPQESSLPYAEDVNNVEALADKIVNATPQTIYNEEESQLQINFPKELEDAIKARHAGIVKPSDVTSNPSTPGQAILDRLEKKAYQSDRPLPIEGKKPIPKDVLVDEQGNPLVSPESKKASEPLRDNEKKAMGVEDKPIVAGKEYDPYSLDTLHDLHKITEPEKVETPKEKPRSLEEQALSEAKAKIDTPDLLKRGQDISKMDEEGLTKLRADLDETLKNVIHDEDLRAEVKNSINKRPELSKEVNDLLTLRDKVATREHAFASDRRAKEGKQDLDISNISTPENRRKILTDPSYRTAAAHKLDPTFPKRVEKGFVGRTIKEALKNIDFPNKLSFIGDWLDRTNTKIKFVDELPENTPARVSFDNKGTLMEISRKMLTNKAELHQTIIHEAIHGVLQLPENKKVWDKIQPEFEKVVETIKREFENDKQVTDKLDKYVVDQIEYALSKNGEAGFTELVTQALSSPAVARYFAMIKVGDKPSGTKTVWTKVKEWIKSIGSATNSFSDKNPEGITHSALDEVTDIVGKVNSDLEGSSPYPSRPTGRPDGNEPIVYNSRRLEEKQVQDDRERMSLERKKREDTKYRGQYQRAANERYGEDLAKKSRIAESEYERPNKTDELDDKVQGKKEPYQTIGYNEVQIDKSILDFRSMKAEKFIDVHSLDNTLSNMSGIFSKVKTTLMKYNDLNITPIYKAELSPKFRNYAYRPGELSIRESHLHENRIMNSLQFWGEGALLHKMAGVGGKEAILKSMAGEIDYKPKAQQFMERIQQYDQGRYTGQIKDDIPAKDFPKWAGFDSEQTAVYEAYHKSLNEAINLQKVYEKKMLLDYDNDLIKYMDANTIKKLAKLGGYETKEQLTEWRRKVNADPAIKEMVADYIIDQKYKDWGKNHYYNAVRPVSPKTWIVEAQKLRKTEIKLNEETGLEEPHDTFDRISTYFDTKEEKDAYKEKLDLAGYRVTEEYNVGQLIKDKTAVNKLNAHQVLELALQGNISLDNPVIDKLLEATKRGINVHTNRKEYIPGMKYTVGEFERQLQRFVGEATNGSIKPYYYRAISDNLLTWKAKLNDAIKSGHSPEALEIEKHDWEYGQRYFNQLRSADKSVVDGLRGFAIAWQVGGFKPSFLFQQASQIFQTTLPQVVQQMKESGGTTGEGINVFNKAIVNAANVGLALRAKNAGKDISSFGVDKEMVDILEKLQWMDKISPTGLSELTSDAGSIDFTYESGLGKDLMVFKKIMTSLGRGVEKWTRTHAAMTFYEIGKKRGLSGNDLLDYCADGVDKTMSEWGKGGRAPLFDSKGSSPSDNTVATALKKSFMTYKTFMFNNWGMWNDMVRNRHQAGVATKMMLAAGMGGLTRLPLMASVLYIAQMFTDKDMDYEMWKLADKLDEQVPHLGGVLHRGIASTIGLDLRQMWGENTPLASDLWAESWSKTWEGKLVDITLGAPLGFSKESISALNEFRTDAWNQIFDNSAFMTEKEKARTDRIKEKIFPVFVRNFLQASRMEKDGIEVQGKKIVMRDDLSAYDIALKMLSFPIEKATRAYSEHDGGVEAQYNAAKEILSRGSQHRKDMIEQGIPQDQIDSEMKRVVKSMNEARQKITELEPEVRKLKRERKLHK